MATAARRSPRSHVVRLALVALIVLLTSCMTREEQDAYDRLNALRASRGLATLPEDGLLAAKARAHAERMAQRGQLYHSVLTDGVGDHWRLIGENVAVAHDVATAHQALVDSPSHLANMVDRRYDHVGIGAYVSPDGRVWVAQVFKQT